MYTGSDQLNTLEVENKGRAVGGTEFSWCKAVPGGTGIAVLALLTSKPVDTSSLQHALHKLQSSHPILKSKLCSDMNTNTLFFTTPPSPTLDIKYFNFSSSISEGIGKFSDFPKSDRSVDVSPFHLILEHELNQNAWLHSRTRPSTTCSSADMFFASIYELPDTKWVTVLRAHVAACDRTTAVSLLRELSVLINEGEGAVRGNEIGNKGEVNVALEDLIPSSKARKTIWARGVGMLSYSLNSFRLTNLKFKDTGFPRYSQVVRLQLDHDSTQKLLSGCSSRGIKLCGALTAAGLMATYSSKLGPHHQQHKKKYGIVTLVDCRSITEPPLSIHNFGFYHSAILNTHVLKGGEVFWELAQKTYGAFAKSKGSNMQFSDMADLNFLMCKAIENPSLTSSSSLRTSLMSVFEDTVIDDDSEEQSKIDLEDYIGCASVHGIGPSIAVFDIVRKGKLDCACVYPAPLHSREQMQGLVETMKAILVEAVLGRAI